MKTSRHKPKPMTPEEIRAADIRRGLAAVVWARNSIRAVEADSILREAVEAVCAAAGCRW